MSRLRGCDAPTGAAECGSSTRSTAQPTRRTRLRSQRRRGPPRGPRSQLLLLGLGTPCPDARHALGFDRIDEEGPGTDAHRLAAFRNAAQLTGYQAADRLDAPFGVDLASRQLVEVVGVESAVHAQRAIRQLHAERRLAVVLVLDLTHDLFEDILDRHDPGGATILVDDHRHVHAIALKLPEEIVDLLTLRDEGRLDQERLEG